MYREKGKIVNIKSKLLKKSITQNLLKINSNYLASAPVNIDWFTPQVYYNIAAARPKSPKRRK